MQQAATATSAHASLRNAACCRVSASASSCAGTTSTAMKLQYVASAIATT